MSGSLAERVLERLKTARSGRLTADEVAGLEAEPKKSLACCKLLGMHYYNQGDYARSADYAEAVHKTRPTRENARNLIAALTRAHRPDDALAVAKASEGHFEDFEHASVMCELHCDLGQPDEAIAFGTTALELKDALTPLAERPDPVTRPFDPGRPERNIIAFSLFGAQWQYLKGALNNAIVARYLYPGWTPRFYVDDSVPADTVQALLQEGAQVRKAVKLPVEPYGLFWRFLVEDDGDVDLYLVRDADSVMNMRERAAVEDWLASGRPYHVMRDNPKHCELMLAGMWGAHRGNLGPMGEAIAAYVEANAGRLNDRALDQKFLRDTIWPLIRRDALVHDACFGFGDTTPFRDEFALPPPMHVGQNDSVRFRMTPAAGKPKTG